MPIFVARLPRETKSSISLSLPRYITEIPPLLLIEPVEVDDETGKSNLCRWHTLFGVAAVAAIQYQFYPPCTG